MFDLETLLYIHLVSYFFKTMFVYVSYFLQIFCRIGNIKNKSIEINTKLRKNIFNNVFAVESCGWNEKERYAMRYSRENEGYIPPSEIREGSDRALEHESRRLRRNAGRTMDTGNQELVLRHPGVCAYDVPVTMLRVKKRVPPRKRPPTILQVLQNTSFRVCSPFNRSHSSANHTLSSLLR